MVKPRSLFATAPPPLGEDGLSFARVNRDLLKLLDHHQVDRAHLVAISVGVMIAQDFALGRPDRVAALTPIATASAFADDARAAMRDWADRLSAVGMAGVIDETIE